MLLKRYTSRQYGLRSPRSDQKGTAETRTAPQRYPPRGAPSLNGRLEYATRHPSCMDVGTLAPVKRDDNKGLSLWFLCTLARAQKTETRARSAGSCARSRRWFTATKITAVSSLRAQSSDHTGWRQAKETRHDTHDTHGLFDFDTFSLLTVKMMHGVCVVCGHVRGRSRQ